MGAPARGFTRNSARAVGQPGSAVASHMDVQPLPGYPDGPATDELQDAPLAQRHVCELVAARVALRLLADAAQPDRGIDKVAARIGGWNRPMTVADQPVLAGPPGQRGGWGASLGASWDGMGAVLGAGVVDVISALPDWRAPALRAQKLSHQF